MEKEFQARRRSAPGGRVAIRELVAGVCAAIRTILQGGCCAGVSDGGGFCPGQAGVGNIAESQLGHDAPPVAGHTQPSLEPLRCCFPERAEVPSSDMACRRRCHCEGVWARSTGAALVTSIGGACHDEGWVGLRTRRRPRQRARACVAVHRHMPPQPPRWRSAASASDGATPS